MSGIDRIEQLSPAKRALLQSLLQPIAPASVGESAPRNRTEAMLCEIWSQVLAVEKIGIHDRFIAIGGDSIRAIQISARARKRGLNVTANQCLEYETIERLAEHIGGMVDQDPTWFRPQDASASHDSHLLSFGEERIWIQDRTTPNVPVCNTFTGLRIFGPLEISVFERTIDELVRRHELLRTTYVMRQGRLVRRLAEPRPFVLRTVELGSSNETIEQLAASETARPFDTERDPLFRCLCIEISPTEHVLIVTAHHIICDAWSMRILIDDLLRIYESCASGYASPLDAPPTRYVDFANWQRELFASGRLANELAWWRKRLDAAPLVHSLPTSHPRPTRQDFRSEIVYFDIPADSGTRLNATAKRLGCTPYVTLLSAWHLLLHRHSRAADIVIGTPVAGRPADELQQVVGFFLNTVPLRLGIHDSWTLRELLTANHNAALDSFKHSNISFEKVVSSLGLPRSQSYSPLVQLWFVLQEPTRRELRCAGLRLEGIDLPRQFSPFELAMSMEARDGGFHGWLEFSAALFDRAAATAMVKQYTDILQAFPDALDEDCQSFLQRTCGSISAISRVSAGGG
jgi:aryl carrier-like protein